MTTSAVSRQKPKLNQQLPPTQLSTPLMHPESTTRGTHAAVLALIREESNCRRLLDIPCGYGAILEHMQEDGIEAYGADVLNTIARPSDHFRIANMDETLPYEDGEFDIVTCIDGIEHIERQFDFVRECHRILKPGGSLIISTPNISSLRSRFRWFLTGFHNKARTPLDETNARPNHHRGMICFHELRYLLHSNGYEISAVRTNRIKAISWPYVVFMPLSYLMTRMIFSREERDPGQQARNKEILRQMHSFAVLLGETIVLKAKRLA
jgi:SAM-dependent methyltransferase